MVGIKHNDCAGDNTQAKTKRTFRNSVICSLRAGDRIVVPKASDELPTDGNAQAKRSTANRSYQYMRPIRCNYENHRYISQASKRMDETKKKLRKRSVIGSLSSILGPENRSGKSDLPPQPDISVRLSSRKKSGNIATAPENDGLDLPTYRKRQTTPPTTPASFSKQREEKNKKDRKQRGYLTSTLNPADKLLTLSDDHAHVDLIEALKGSTPCSRKKPSMCHIARAPRKVEEKVKAVEIPKPIESLTSFSGLEDEALVIPNGGVRLTSTMKPTSTTVVAIATNGTTSHTLVTRKGHLGSDPVSTRPEPEKDDKQIVEEKVRIMGNIKKFQFNEMKVREQIRVKLRKNQQKYESLAAALASNKAKATSDKLSSTPPPPKLPLEATKVLITKSYSIPAKSKTSNQQPRLRSRARNGRLHSACKRIPATIPEESLPESSNSRDTRRAVLKERRCSQGNKKTSIKGKTFPYHQSPKKAKASFYPRSPKNSPGRNRRRFRVLAPHPTELVGSCTDNHGGLCMTFPTKKKKGKKNEETERRIGMHRIQGLM